METREGGRRDEQEQENRSGMSGAVEGGNVVIRRNPGGVRANLRPEKGQLNKAE